METFLQVITTVDQKEMAEKIAGHLVEKGLAACVQVLGPITSTYRWKGQIETAEEWQCLAKTTDRLYGQVEQAIKSIHPYETPEIIATPIIAGSKDYLDWLRGELTR